MADEQVEKFEQWAVVDLFGHQRLAGRVTEQVIAGTGFLRIEVPRDDGTSVTKLQNPKSVYSLQPCSEEVARECAKRLIGIEPIRPMEFKQLPGASAIEDRDDDGEEDRPW
jgi:hypothetical protein